MSSCQQQVRAHGRKSAQAICDCREEVRCELVAKGEHAQLSGTVRRTVAVKKKLDFN